VIAVSAVCRDYLVEKLGVAPEKITVIHHGVHDRFHPEGPEARPAALFERLGLASPYLLCVGNPYPHKNVETAIRALALLRRGERHRQLRLAIVGSRSYAGDRLDALIERLGLAGAVVFTDFVKHEDLVHVYNGAEALLFCSIYEAFPNPIVEAMACGIPVVAADRGAVAEVSGGACVLVPDPSDHEAFARETERILTDRAHRRRLAEAGLERATAFRWDESVRRVLEVYASIADEKAR
jgi:glycosyltransferase involved in cell wall biosynthesis